SIGLTTALELVQGRRAEESVRLKVLQDLFFKLLEEQVPGIMVNGSRKHRLPNNVHVTIPGQDNERVLIGLDEAGVLAAAGSACSASSEEPSHVLRAMGLSSEAAQSSLRFSMGLHTGEASIRKAVAALAAIIARR
ncbi:MAG: aminotransferase class V-fold PLP-dependent enzyme, partial [Patescibacteria group bacterium]